MQFQYPWHFWPEKSKGQSPCFPPLLLDSSRQASERPRIASYLLPEDLKETKIARFPASELNVSAIYRGHYLPTGLSHKVVITHSIEALETFVIFIDPEPDLHLPMRIAMTCSINRDPAEIRWGSATWECRCHLQRLVWCSVLQGDQSQNGEPCHWHPERHIGTSKCLLHLLTTNNLHLYLPCTIMGSHLKLQLHLAFYISEPRVDSILYVDFFVSNLRNLNVSSVAPPIKSITTRNPYLTYAYLRSTQDDGETDRDRWNIVRIDRDVFSYIIVELPHCLSM